MKYYAVVEFTVTNPEWLPEYGVEVTKMVEKWEGKYLARTSELEVIEGDIEPKTIAVIIEWPSKDAAISFYNSEEYKPFLDARLAGSKGTFMLVAGKDDMAS